MQRYIIVRVFQAIIALLAVSVIVFFLTRITGNPMDVLMPQEVMQEDFDRIRKAWGLDKPLHIQYLTFVGNALKGEFGESWKWPGNTAMQLIIGRFPATLKLAGASLAVSVLISVPLGVLSAVKKDSIFDYMGKSIALLGQSLPAFWLGIVLMWVFAVSLQWVPTSGQTGVSSFILPAVAIGWFQVAAMMRLVRSSMLDVLDTEYVKLARIKGLPEWKVVWKRCLRNAAITPLTYFGLLIGSLLVGSVSIETVFNWPGVGLLAVEAARSRDYQVIQAVILVFCGIYIISNLLVDIAYAYLDPRIRYQ